ncbi:MAG TPA: hypothetical protein VHQ66_01085 [Myxococcota bacterium]|nr:hypothetical protein [Myxococcota bacterium]
MHHAYAPRRHSDELGFVPLWRERSFLRTLLVFGGAALLPVALAPAPPAWPAAGLVLLSLLAAVDLGALAPADGARADALRGLRFAAFAAVAPLFLGLLAAAAGVGFGRWVALPLLGVGALLALASIAPLEAAADPDDSAPRGGRALLAAGAALSLATASLWRAAAHGAEVRLGELPLPALAASLLVALAAGCAVAAAGFVGGAALRRLRYRSFAAPRAAAAALLLAASGGIAAAGIAWV